MLLEKYWNWNRVTKNLLRYWSDWLQSQIKGTIWLLLLEDVSTTENEKLINNQELTNVVINDLVIEIFDYIAKKYKKMKVYSKEELFANMKILFEKYLNWKERLNEKVEVWVYFWFKTEKWENWFIDYLDKESWRKKYYSEDKFNDLLWFNISDYLPNDSKHDSYVYIAEKNCLIIINSEFDNGYYIINLTWLKEFDKVIIDIIKNKVVDLVRDKISLILAKYIDSMTWCKNSTYIDEHNFTKNLSIAEFDISNLKNFNDVYWRENWDLAIKHFWNILKSCVRKDEWEVVHISWDEFCIIVRRDNNWHLDIWKNIFTRLNKLKEDLKLKFTFQFEGQNITKEYDFKHWICYNDGENWNLTLWEWLIIADSRLSKKKWSDWLSSRLTAILKDYDLPKQVNALWKNLDDLYWNLPHYKRMAIIDSLSKYLK